MATQHIVFIHGLFMNPKSWGGWVSHFSQLGYICHTPAYPYHDGEPSSLRAQLDARLGMLTLHQVTEHLANYIRALPEKPILVGHSMGGLIVQKLVSMGLGSLGVCINSAPPQGIFTFKWSFLRANFSTVDPSKGNSVCLPSVHWFQYAFCNSLTLMQAQKEYTQFVVPESRNIARTSIIHEGAVNFSQPHVPLLFVAGEKDRLTPEKLNQKNAQAYTDANSSVDFVVFPYRTHYICNESGWQEVATTIHQWIARQSA